MQSLFPEITQITDTALRDAVTQIWIETAKECAWDQFQDCPKGLGAERYRSLTDHVRGVTRMALALAEVGAREHGAVYNRDYLIAACLLHDVSKPIETDPDPLGTPTDGPAKPAKKSAIGDAIQHAVYATHKCFAHNLPLPVTHIVNTHTHASAVRSKSLEGAYLFYADYADSDTGVFPTGEKMFAERWELS